MATDAAAAAAAAAAANATPLTSAPSDPLWEGEAMFNIYIYDYCLKRGFARTAAELMSEAKLSPHAQPPINAKQGLLFEWWSVFWVLFTAKSGGPGATEDALLYYQHYNATNPSSTAKANRSMQQDRNPQRSNGRQPQSSQPNQVTNGASGSAPPQGMPNGTQSTVPFPGNGPNGMPAPGPNGPPPMANQRRNGGPPFQSPTMAHSPPNQGGASQPPPSNSGPVANLGPVGVGAPLAQMVPGRGNMAPPSGPPGTSQQTPQPAFQQLGRSPSNPSSPANPMMTHPSPSMAARQPNDVLNIEFSRIPQPWQARLKADIGCESKPVLSLTADEKNQILQQFRRLPAHTRNNPPPPIQSYQMPPNPQGPQPPQLLPQGQPMNRTNKRNSTSPGQEAEQLPQNGSSPPDRKRPRRSPNGNEQQSQPPQHQQPMAPMYGQPPQAGLPPHLQQQNPIMAGGRPMQMGPYPGQPMQNMAGGPMQMQMGGHGMNPQMVHQMQGIGMMTPQMYRQSMQTLHKPGTVPGSAGSPSAGDGQQQGDQQRPPTGQFGPPGGMNNRMVGKQGMNMMPPPSPAQNAKPGQSKDGEGGRPDASPARGATPGQAHTPAGVDGGAGPSMTAPSPSAMHGASTPSMGGPTPQDMLTQDIFTDGAFGLDLDSEWFNPAGFGDSSGLAGGL